MDPHIAALGSALAVSLVGAALLYALPGECRCPSCPKHVREREEKTRRQVELQHDYQHKGGGFRPGDPDLYSRTDERCPRNPRRS